MTFAPWLAQPKPDDEPPTYDPDDPRLLKNILKPEPGEKLTDWFLDHLVAEPPPENG